MIVTWKGNRPTLSFNDIQPGDSYRISSDRSRGAVYTKVKDYHGVFWQMELETASLFPATTSPIEKVDVECNILANSPN